MAVAHVATTSPSPSSRLLGLAGILGGAVLLAAFFVDIAPGLNTIRLVLFSVGAIAIVVAVHRCQNSADPTLALLAAVPALLANALELAWNVFAAGRAGPTGAAAFGLIGFLVAAAMWLTDAAFGLATLRLGVVARWGPLALAIGSILAFTGLDRLELTSPANPTIFGPLALTGIALNGVGWILMGLDVATRRRTSAA